MHDFPSDAFGRDISLNELSFWSQIDLQTLSGELKARIKEVNVKISRDEARGVWNKRLLNARSYLECYRNKVVQELINHYHDGGLRNAQEELTILKKQLAHHKNRSQTLQDFVFNFQRLLAHRFGAETIQEIATEAHGLTPS